jgi:hypothetical protein
VSYAGLLVAVIGFLVLCLWIGAPLLQKPRQSGQDEAIIREKDTLKMAYSAAIRSIRDLDEDFATGKIPEADYQRERERWMTEGTDLLRELDAVRARQRAQIAAAKNKA